MEYFALSALMGFLIGLLGSWHFRSQNNRTRIRGAAITTLNVISEVILFEIVAVWYLGMRYADVVASQHVLILHGVVATIFCSTAILINFWSLAPKSSGARKVRKV